MEDYNKEKLLRIIAQLEEGKGICPEADRKADEQITECWKSIDRIREVS